MRVQALSILGLGALLNACKGGGGKGSGDGDDTAPQGDGKTRVTILHTNDWHSHLVGWGPNAEYSPGTTGDDSTVGGVARMKALIDQIRADSDHPVVLYDAGDWEYGDVFQLIGGTHATELQMFQALGYDAVTLGNHEFDLGPEHLGEVIAKADELGVTVPILAANTVPNASDAGDDALEAHFDSGRIQGTMVQTLDNGITVGLVGLLGDEAASITPAVVPSSFTPILDVAGPSVADLEAQGVDLVIAITHNGVTDDPTTSPDEILAAAVPDIDVIVGGHSHTPLPTPLHGGDHTVILQAGSFTEYLGELTLVQNDAGGWDTEDYVLHTIDDTIGGDADITTKVDGFKQDLEDGPLAALGFTYDQPIAHIPGDVVTPDCSESGLGDLITDAYRNTMNANAPAHPIDFAFETQGVIRDDLLAGNNGVEAFSDMFRILPLGGGSDDVPGYPLVDFYVSAKELKTVCEVTASVSPYYGCDYFIELSGMRCNLDATMQLFNRAVGVDQWSGSDWTPVDITSANTQLYHVAVDSYTASLIFVLGDLTSGLLNVTPKDMSGTAISNPGDATFDVDPATAGVQELKLWQALIAYSSSFPDSTGDAVPDLPEGYTGPAGRIVGYVP